MPSTESKQHIGLPRQVLFVQATEPGVYPPLINASLLMAEAGWGVTFLAAPIAGNRLELAAHPRITRRATSIRSSYVVSKRAYAGYFAAAAWLALRLRPDIVYASDPLGAGPALVAASLARARLVYHEHDSPPPGRLRPFLARARASAARRADLVIFPNPARARFAQSEIEFSPDRLRILWNMPRRGEVPPVCSRPESPLMLYYHGSIAPDRLTLAVVEAVRRLGGRAHLRIAGYEASSASGYLQRLIELGGGTGRAGVVHYVGQVSRADLVNLAARAHVGLALIRPDRDDLNMTNLTGASNKAFDYMAAGLALLVADRPDWREMFVEPGYARACDPADPESIVAALHWFIEHPEQTTQMGTRGRDKITAEWNYDTAFASIIKYLAHVTKRH